jgi:predicted MPP superfamily phosphohydrolase
VRFAVILAILFLLNVITVWQLLRIHPRRRRMILTLAVAGNLIWVAIPLLGRLTAPMRLFRAFAGPVWIGWTLFSLLYVPFLVVVLAAWLVLHRRPFPEYARRSSAVFITILIVTFAIGCWQALVPLRIEHVTVAIDGLPAEAEGTRIALMGDLHVGLFTRPSRLRTIFATAAAQHPDAVVIVGDLVDDDPYYAPKLLAGTASLPPNIPLFAVLGNHEMYGDPHAVIGRLAGSRIRLLVNEGVPLRGLWLAGLSDLAARSADLRPDLGKALAGKPAGATPIVIAHQPRAFDEARRRGMPLTLVAHTHGGQCGIRPLGWSVAGIFVRYHMGLYREGSSQLYVNTGTGFWVFPFRLGMTPEITVIELRRS